MNSRLEVLAEFLSPFDWRVSQSAWWQMRDSYEINEHAASIGSFGRGVNALYHWDNNQSTDVTRQNDCPG